MDLVIVAFYTLCDALLIQHGYQDDPRTNGRFTYTITTGSG